MARVTIEDCLSEGKNRFQVVLEASARARQLAMGSVEAIVPWENHKATVVALKEIASGGLSAAQDHTTENEPAD